MSFAALEARVNASVFKHMANAQATVDGNPVDVIFDGAYVTSDVGMGMANARPAITLATSDVPATPNGKPVIVNGVTYAIAAHEPDGTGVSVLLLERTA